MKMNTILTSIFFMIPLGFLGCVELPTSEPPRPDAISQFRFVVVDSSLSSNVIVKMASGPNFTVYSDLPAETFANPNAVYRTYLAGDKKMFLHNGVVPVDPDTSSVSFSPDERGTVFVILLDPDTKVRFVRVSERYVFALPGITDTARVRVFNATSSRDTIDVFRPSSSIPVVDNLRFGRVSSLLKVPAGTTMQFYLAKYNSPAAQGTDTVTITGASNKQYTIVAYDSLAIARFVLFEDK